MGDTVFEYVAMANAAPVPKFTNATAGQTTVMDNIAAAGDVVSVIVLDNPRTVEFNSVTVEVGQSFVTYAPPSSPIIDRVLFETTEGRLAFVQNVVAQWSQIKPSQGIPVEPEVAWRGDQFEAAIQADVDAINEIEAAVDAVTTLMLEKPEISLVTSVTIRANEAVVLLNFAGVPDVIKVHLGSALDITSFVHKFMIPLAAGIALAGIVVRQ